MLCAALEEATFFQICAWAAQRRATYSPISEGQGSGTVSIELSGFFSPQFSANKIGLFYDDILKPNEILIVNLTTEWF